MAIDTRDKRMSVLSLGLPYARVLPNPDGSLSAVADREQLEFSYRGIAFSGSSPSSLIPALLRGGNIGSAYR